MIFIQKQAAQQSVHLTLGILRQSQAVFYALAFFQLDGFAVPAPAQVPITALVKRSPKINDFYKCQVESIQSRESRKTPTALFLSQFILEQARLRHPRHCL